MNLSETQSFALGVPVLPPQQISIDVLLEKYCKGDEKMAEDIFRRVAKAVAGVEPTQALALEWEQRFLENMNDGAVGAGRIMSAAGAGIQATLINCFVMPVGDCIQGVDEDGCPGIYEALREAAETMRRGGGCGYSFSRIRPRNAQVKGTASVASGPCSYMNVFDQSCATVESAGARRGAQMGVLDIWHPDIEEFITAKRTPGRWNNFNVSVGVTDAFIQALKNNEIWQLVHKARPCEAALAKGAYQRSDGLWVYKEVPAQQLWDTIMRSAYDFAEPGILFLDRMNKDNNLWYVEKIEATNPCGEEPLPAYGCCDLGPIILPRFVRDPFGSHPSFDFAAFEKAVAVQVRFLDNVLDLTHWPLEAQRQESISKRRIGIGFTGLGDALCMLKLRYDSEEAQSMGAQIARAERDAAYRASIELAKEKGAFPLFDAEKYLGGESFASRLPEDIKRSIREHGIRNSHLLSIAPTGTVSLALADNASNGIEPAFSWSYQRKKREADGTHSFYDVQDHAWRVFKAMGGDTKKLPAYFQSALEMGVDGHIGMMQAVQPYIDTSISKTVNVPVDFPFEDFKDMYIKAHEAGLKGLSTYRPNTVLGAVLSTTPEPAVATPVQSAPAALPAPVAPAPSVDLINGVIEKRPMGALPAVAEKIEYWTQEGHKTLYLLVSFMPVGVDDQGRAIERAVEFFMPVGQNGESQQWISASMRLLSLAARGGFLERALDDMRKVVWDKGPVRLGHYEKEDGTRVPMWHDSEVSAIAYALQQIIAARAKFLREHLASPYTEGSPAPAIEPFESSNQGASITHGNMAVMPGKKCSECGAYATVKKDGCEFCTNCGHLGSCG